MLVVKTNANWIIYSLYPNHSILFNLFYDTKMPKNPLESRFSLKSQDSLKCVLWFAVAFYQLLTKSHFFKSSYLIAIANVTVNETWDQKQGSPVKSLDLRNHFFMIFG